jgi:hypothetical protein
MVFDDHDVSDDWNLDYGWWYGVRENETGRRVVANALAAFWAFQGWGNNPDNFSTAFIKTIVDHLARMRKHGGKQPFLGFNDFDAPLWDFRGWEFLVPTDPVTVGLDSRTDRYFRGGDQAAQLMSNDTRTRLTKLLKDRKNEPLVVIAPAPVFGLGLLEQLQEGVAVPMDGKYSADFSMSHMGRRRGAWERQRYQDPLPRRGQDGNLVRRTPGMLHPWQEQ